jgi:GT2 family glycosyltransferase
MKSVSIIIVNYNLTENIRSLLHSIDNFVTNIDYEVVIVDNNSPDRNIESLTTEFPQFRFEFLNTNYGFGHGNNVGASKTTGKYLLLLNPDTYLVENLPLTLFNFAEIQPTFGVIGPQMNYPDGSFQISYAKFPNVKQEIAKGMRIIRPLLTKLHKIKCIISKEKFFKVDFVFGSCMFIRREVFEEVNGFDEEYFLIVEETDLCYKIKRDTKFSIVYWQTPKIHHLKSQITGKDITARLRQEYISKLKFFLKHYSAFKILILRVTIVFIFTLKYIVHSAKKERKQKVKDVYQHIIKLYLKPYSIIK